MNLLRLALALLAALRASPSGSSWSWSSKLISVEGFLKNLERDNTIYDYAWTLASPVFYCCGVYDSDALLKCGAVLVLCVAQLVGMNEYHWRGPIYCFFLMKAFSMDEQFAVCYVPSLIAVVMCLMNKSKSKSKSKSSRTASESVPGPAH